MCVYGRNAPGPANRDPHEISLGKDWLDQRLKHILICSQASTADLMA